MYLLMCEIWHFLIVDIFGFFILKSVNGFDIVPHWIYGVDIFSDYIQLAFAETLAKWVTNDL